MSRLVITGLGVARGKRDIIRDVSLTAEPGTITAILGPNGAGKSTLLKAMLGLIPAHVGSVLCDGIDLRVLPARERARRMAYVPQRTQLGFAMTVAALVAQGRYAHAAGLGRMAPRDRHAVDEALAAADVTALADRVFTQLSGGEQSRVLLARALAVEAPVLLLDEPTASLDIAHVLALLARLRALADAGRCVVIVLHRIDEALRIADAALLLERGATAAQGPARAVLTPEHIRRVYGVEMHEALAPVFHLPQGTP